MKKIILGVSLVIILSLTCSACNLFGFDQDDVETVEVQEVIIIPDGKPNRRPDQRTDGQITEVSVESEQEQNQDPPRPCNQASFVSETIPDGSQFTAGEDFTKSWRLQNTGTCTWNTDYQLVYQSGERMGGSVKTNLLQSIQQGETVDLEIELAAPQSTGAYTGYWMLVSDEREEFASFWVNIEVVSGQPQTVFAVTGVNLTADKNFKKGNCPVTFNLEAEITTNDAGDVTYYWMFSDGSSSPSSTLQFSSAGTQTVSTSWSISTMGGHSASLYIDDPNHQEFGPINLILTCMP